MRLRRLLIATLPFLSAAAPSPARAEAEAAPRPDPAAVEFFEKKVRPVLVVNCYNCHSANTNAKGGLRVDDRNGLLAGGNSGAAVVPGDPSGSLLLQTVRHEDDVPKMPPKKSLTPEQKADLERWIKEGAAWPAVEAVATGKPNAKYDKLRKEHWAWQPLSRPAVPEVRDASWPVGDVDRFILAAQEKQGLAPVADADRLTLIRRVTFDLTGLPPTPEAIGAFLADASTDAYEKLVDRLLASPAYGEQWARHWLDVARYAESTGGSRNVPFPHAWRYRDYVVDAFTRDKPYDQFVREQVAGDLLPSESAEERDERVIATGFLAVGVKDVNQRFKVRFVMDNVDEQIDAVSRSFLGVTASCARCHDHKFDPIPTADYYALAGIFKSTDLCAGVRNKMGGGGLDYYDTDMLVVLGGNAGSPADDAATKEKIAKARKAVAEAKAEFERLRDGPEGSQLSPDGRPKRAVARQKFNRLQVELSSLTDPAANGAKVALAVRDAKVIADTEIRLRGEAEKLGPVVPRGFLSVVPVADAPAVPSSQSGRLELAQWLTSETNPLTPRVMVNRVWQHLLGRGIVASVDNFGVNGTRPTHPELLDHLAGRFVADGWSVKRLVRSIVLSRVYRLSAETTAANLAGDEPNQFLWRHAPRRLTGEEIRDATLAAAGTLDPARPDGSPAKELKVMELPNNGPVARKLGDDARGSRHRSLYMPLLRGLVPTALEVFDFAEQGNVSGSRDTTTVATQALYLLNDPFVRRQSLNLAERLVGRTDLDDAGRAALAYRLTLGRAPTDAELTRVATFLADFEASACEVLAAAPPEPAPAPEPVAVAANDDKASKKPAPPVNPDEVIQSDEPVKEEVIQASDARTAAWAAFSQALLGSAEFRYVK